MLAIFGLTTQSKNLQMHMHITYMHHVHHIKNIVHTHTVP
jgi:hypothetical protein